MSEHYAADLAAEERRWSERGLPRPQVVVVAGSGLGVDLGEPTHGPFPLAELLPFAVTAVAGHALSWELIEPVPGRPVLYYRGRLHAYQGFEPGQVVFAVRLGVLLGARLLLVSNAAGGIDPERPPGSLVLLRDHLNLSGLNPLRGEPPSQWGPRFPDMVGVYPPALRDLAGRCAREAGLELVEGVYCGLLGPSYETPAEVEMVRRLGADLVGMSTVLEVIAARHLGASSLGLSLVTNLAAGVGEGHLDHEEVIETGRRAARDVERLLRRVLAAPELLDCASPSGG
jgi:purine-nucleoside phosphorylase